MAGVELFSTARVTFKKNKYLERVNPTIKKSLRNIFIHSCIAANLCAECLQAVCEALNCKLGTGRRSPTEKQLTDVQPTAAHI